MNGVHRKAAPGAWTVPRCNTRRVSGVRERVEAEARNLEKEWAVRSRHHDIDAENTSVLDVLGPG
jgi:hypothetical protein